MKSDKFQKIKGKEAHYFQFLRKPKKVTYGPAKLLKTPNRNRVFRRSNNPAENFCDF